MTDRQTSPGRPRSFDEAAALERIVQVFWEHGYAGTSYPQLEAATGLHRQSLRYAFGPKEALFLRALDHYTATRFAGLSARLHEAPTPLDGIAALFAEWAGDAADARGCLALNTAAELGEGVPGAADILARDNRSILAALAGAFARARDAGQLRPGLDPEALAVQALALADGLIMHGRAGTDSFPAGAALTGFLDLIRS